MKEQYGSPISKEMVQLIVTSVHGMIQGEDVTYMCGSAMDGTLIVVDGRTGLGYAFDHHDLLRLAKENDWAEQTEPKYGKLIESGALFLRKEIATGSMGGKEYLMQTTATGNQIIESKATGKRFMLDWQDILNLAIAGGVDESDEESGE
ncbi:MULTISPECIES: hypothetical protein [unclassified Neisseria]|uniref:hypothetical protein n=1 Tax=unclassified Neisseria TaxID=2623750 RepID=UPI001D1630C3|nr:MULTISPECIES: hypothetical protein [unclassified Neisseria]